jgi:glycosyltransferase involved in cell wall biosynthesis
MLAAPLRGVGSLCLPEADYLVVDEPRFLGAALAPASRATLTCRATLTYRATDLYAAMRGDPRIADAERMLCRRADLIVATSEAVASHLRALSGRQAHLISNGVDYTHFAAVRDLPHEVAALPGERASRAVYVGAFDARFCTASLRAAALALPGRTFLLAGPGSERVAMALALPNIHATGPMPYETLPALLQACAVGLLPFSPDAANAGRSPMKLFEYAAAGLTIAATSSFRRGRAPMPTLSIAASPEDFARAVGAAFELSSDAALLGQARESARAEDWAVKAAELLRLMQQARAEAALHEPAAAEAPPLRMRNSWN